jgi:hypothetical protein
MLNNSLNGPFIINCLELRFYSPRVRSEAGLRLRTYYTVQ